MFRIFPISLLAMNGSIAEVETILIFIEKDDNKNESSSKQ